MHFSRLLSLLLFATLPLGATIEWQTDYEKVRSTGEKENKPLLLFFNGSDWAGSAMKMKHEILNTPAFQEKIAPQFVCMEVDFPMHTPPVPVVAEQNLELKKRFKVQELPSLLLLDARERVIAQIGYLPVSGEQLACNLLKIVEQDAELCAGLQHLNDPSATPLVLKKLYQLAQELGCGPASEQILEAGLKTEDPYFCLERYRLLVEKGEMKNEETVALRQKLLGFDPESEFVNGQGIPFTLALIDFQELSQKNYEAEIAAQPLIEYLARFGKNDQKNIWRIEMMIAEIYLAADQWEEALKHAEQAYQASPEALHEEIAHSLDYIRSARNIPR
jgi:protein disulfide-isomerase